MKHPSELAAIGSRTGSPTEAEERQGIAGPRRRGRESPLVLGIPSVSVKGPCTESPLHGRLPARRR